MMASAHLHPGPITVREWLVSAWRHVGSFGRKGAQPSNGGNGEIRVEISETGVIVSQVERDDITEIARMSSADAERLGPAALERIVQNRSRAETSVFLSPGEALRRIVHLPLAAGANLREILRHEVDRQSPIDPDQIYFDYSVRQRDKAANRLEVELRIVKRESIARAIALCRSLGLEPVLIGVTGDDLPFN